MLANVPSPAAGLFAAEYGLATRPLPLDGPSFDVSLVHHARTEDDPGQIWFRDAVAEEVDRLRRAGPSGR